MIPSLGAGWSCFLPMLVGGASVEMGSAKMSWAMLSTAIDGAAFRLTTTEAAESKEVGFGMGLVRIGTEVQCPVVSRVEWKRPLAGFFLLARIWTVPDGVKLVMTLAGDVRTSLGEESFPSRLTSGRDEGSAW